MDTIILRKNEIDLCTGYARTCCIGGPGRVRSQEERDETRLPDNIVGQMGTLAVSIFLYGQDKGIDEYIKARIKADNNPYEGDGGRDLPDLDIDIKCSRMRRSKDAAKRYKDTLSYNFVIPPEERHENWIYIQALSQKMTKHLAYIHIMGWIRDEDIPSYTVRSGTFEGKHLVPIPKLKKFPKSKGLFEEHTVHTLFQ
jgi:hypothetical protein